MTYDGESLWVDRARNAAIVVAIVGALVFFGLAIRECSQ